MPFWDGTRWIDESRQPSPRGGSAAPRARMARLGDAIATTAMVVGLAAVFMPFTAARASGPSIAASPAQGPTGSSVQIIGSSFQANTRMQVTWDGLASGMPTVQINGNGGFKTTIVVPSAAIGSHSVAVVEIVSKGKKTTSRAGATMARASFTLTPLVASPTPTVVSTPSQTPAATLDPSLDPGTVPEPVPSPSTPSSPTATAVATPGSTATPTPLASLTATLAPTSGPTPTPAPASSTAPVFYVAVTGSDSLSGSLAAPWRTIAYAVSVAPAGSTIQINSGTYAPFSVSRSSLNIEPVSGANVTISGGTSGIRVTGSNVTVRHIRVTAAASQGIWVDGAADVELDGLVVENNFGHGIQIIRATSVSVTNSRISWNRLSGLRELDGTSGGFYVGNVISDNGHDGNVYNGDGILLKGQGAVVRANTILRNGDSPDYEHGIYVDELAGDFQIDDNLIRGNSASGIKVSGAGSITRNTISDSPRGLVFADTGSTVSISGNTVDASLFTFFVCSGTDITRFGSDLNLFLFNRFGYIGQVLTLPDWQAQTGLDLHSS